MLLLIGTSLGHKTERVFYGEGNSLSFDKTTVSVLVGRHVEHVELAKGYRGEVPAEGTQCALEVSVRSFPTKAGAGHSLSAWANRSADVAVAEPQPV